MIPFQQRPEYFVPNNEPVRPGASDHLKIPSLRDGERVQYTPPQAFLSSKKSAFNHHDK